MLQVMHGVSRIRAWTCERQGWPCRRLDGRLALGFAGEACLGIEIGWDEFEATFCVQRAVFVCEDASDSRTCFIGPPDEARRFLADMQGWAPRSVAPGRCVESALLVPGSELADVGARTAAGEIR